MHLHATVDGFLDFRMLRRRGCLKTARFGRLQHVGDPDVKLRLDDEGRRVRMQHPEEAVRMAGAVDLAQGEKVCKSCRSRQELSNEYFLANLALIQERTSPLKFAHLVEKSE